MKVEVGDITTFRVDAIVNAANSSLMGGGGVDGAIHRAAGPELTRECAAIRERELPSGLKTGAVAVTGAGRLPCRLVIHTVGPIYGREGGQERHLLRLCYAQSLEAAANRGCRSIAFPSIATGAFGFPEEQAAAVVISALDAHLRRGGGVQDVRLVFFAPASAARFVSSCGRLPDASRHKSPPG